MAMSVHKQNVTYFFTMIVAMELIEMRKTFKKTSIVECQISCETSQRNPGMGVTKPISPICHFILSFHHCWNSGYLLNIMFMFDRCPNRGAVVTPVKYECDSNHLTGSVASLKLLNRVSVPLPPPLVVQASTPSQQRLWKAFLQCAVIQYIDYGNQWAFTKIEGKVHVISVITLIAWRIS